MTSQNTAIKAFITSATDPEQPTQSAGEPITVAIDDREITFNPPDTNQTLLIMAAVEGSSTDGSLAATMINAFFHMVQDDRDVGHLRGRLFNSKDPFSLSDVSAVLMYLMETWSNRPTESSSDSSSSRRAHGKTSKGKRHGAGSTSGTVLSPAGAP